MTISSQPRPAPVLRSGQARPFYRRRRPKPADDSKEVETPDREPTPGHDLDPSRRKFTRKSFYGWFIPHPHGIFRDEM